MIVWNLEKGGEHQKKKLPTDGPENCQPAERRNQLEGKH